MSRTIASRSYEYGARVRAAMMDSFTARDLEDHYRALLTLAFEINGALAEAERRIYELERRKG